MLLDHFTLFAQLINFLLLIWLLKRFLYRPLLSAIDAREERQRQLQEQAREQFAEYQGKAAELEQRSRQLREQQEQLLAQSRAEAAAEKEQILSRARRQSEQLQAELRSNFAAEQQALALQLRERTEKLLLETSADILRDLASTELDDAMLAAFCSRLHALPAAERAKFSATPGGERQVLQLVSAQPLQERHKKQLRQTLDQVFARGDFSARQDPALICGLELYSHSHRLSWSVATRLQQLQEQLLRLNQERSKEPPGAEEHADDKP